MNIVETLRPVALGSLAVIVLSVVAVAEPRSARHFIAHLEGGQEVPIRETNATGQTIFTLSQDETQIGYRLIVANIENVTASHIHLGAAGVNGPVIAFLAGDFPPAGGAVQGVLAEGTITAANLLGPLAGMDFSVLVAAIRVGGVYVNVHTNDGVAPANTGPGDFPGGEFEANSGLSGLRSISRQSYRESSRTPSPPVAMELSCNPRGGVARSAGVGIFPRSKTPLTALLVQRGTVFSSNVAPPSGMTNSLAFLETGVFQCQRCSADDAHAAAPCDSCNSHRRLGSFDMFENQEP